MKLPAYQFYPADWRKDPGVQALSFHDRGVWFEILCLMHESEQRGKLLLGGRPMPESALARLLGLDKQNLTNTLTTLLDFGVASREPETGALISRRMVKDEELRKIRQNAGKLGGNPRLLNQTSNQNPTTQDKQNPTPSSSSSSSSSDITPLIPQGKVHAPKVAWTEAGGWEGITDGMRAEWKEAYPACDVQRQLNAMQVWLRANPTKARRKSWLRFVSNWLSKSQDRGGDTPSNRSGFTPRGVLPATNPGEYLL